MNKKIVGTIVGIIGIILVAGLIVGMFLFQNKENGIEEEPVVDVSALTELLLRDIDKNYPPTPKEVLKYYSEITCCFYNDELTQEQLESLAERSYELYDEELKNNMSMEQYKTDLQQDILDFRGQNIVVSGYSLSASADVERFSQDGYDWARLYATYRLRQGTEYVYSNEVFVLRKDTEGHWKIYGFELANTEDDDTISTETSEVASASDNKQ